MTDNAAGRSRLESYELKALYAERSAGNASAVAAGFAIAYAIMCLTEAQAATAGALHLLGTGNAATQMGAIEYLGPEVKGVAAALGGIADRMMDLP